MHGDDFTTAGPRDQLDWFKAQPERKYELKENCRLGQRKSVDKEGRILNRMVRWTEACLEYKADPRQAEKIIEELGLESATGVSTPATKASLEKIRSDSPLHQSLQRSCSLEQLL